MKHVKLVLTSGVIVLAAGSAQAGSTFSGWDIQVGHWVDGQYQYWSVAQNPQSYQMTEFQSDEGHTRYRVTGSHVTADWSFTFDVIMDPDPFISNSFTLTNTSGLTQNFTVTATIPITPPLPGPNVMSGSMSGTVGDGDGVMDEFGNGATLRTWVGGPGAPYYQALVDGTNARDLFPPPRVDVAPLGLTSDIGTQNFINEAGPAAFLTIGIRNQFNLTDGDNAGMTSTFFIIPTPGAAALGLMGLVVLRRRR